jgi:drug/metabolite transporter (DMT)-like permease
MLKRLSHALYDNAYVLLSLVSLFWAGNQVLGRAVAGSIPPITLGCIRWLLATLILLPFAWRSLRADWPMVRAHLGFLAFLGVIGGGAINTLSYIGLNDTTAMNSLVLNSSAPIFIVLFCFLTFGDRISLRQAIGIVISIAGVLVVVLHGDLAQLASLSLNRGDLFVIAGMACWGVYTAFLRKRPAIAPLSFAVVTFAAAALVNLPLAAGEALAGSLPQPNIETALAFAYTGIFPSVLAYLFFNRSVELIGGSRAGVFTHLVPLFGALLAFGLLGERLGVHHIAGFALILAGIWLAARGA